MSKATVNQIITMKSKATVRSLVIAGITLAGFSSCKSPEHCDAYNSSRSFKKKRVAAVVRELPSSRKLA
jgi:hypothetical protein